MLSGSAYRDVEKSINLQHSSSGYRVETTILSILMSLFTTLFSCRYLIPYATCLNKNLAAYSVSIFK
jgi:hypothetical protein